MGQLANTPSWGVLVKAPVKQVREILASFGEDLIFRENNGWTAAFYMAPVDTSDDEAAERLRSHGFVPVYRFDFSKYQFFTLRWDGAEWSLLEKDLGFVDPDVVLSAVGITAPYWDEAPGAVKSEPLEAREVSIIEGASVEQARALVGDRLHVELGPLGAIVYDPDPDTRFALWDRAPGRVLEVLFYPKLGGFRFRVMKGEDCLGTFRPGKTSTWDGTPFLDNVEGETTPEGIIEKLGIARSFLARA
jgi:hypothetical protein